MDLQLHQRGTQEKSWIDHLLVKKLITYQGIDHSGFGFNISDDRPDILGLTAPILNQLRDQGSVPRGSLYFPRHDVMPVFHSVSNFQHNMQATLLPNLINPTLEDCLQAYTNILGFSVKSLPKWKTDKSLKGWMDPSHGWTQNSDEHAKTNKLASKDRQSPGSKCHRDSLDNR